MGFIQFCRKDEKKVRLGIITENGEKYCELPETKCFRSDMISFIKQNFTYEQLKMQIENLKEKEIDDNIKLLPPILNPEKIICILENYKKNNETEADGNETNEIKKDKNMNELLLLGKYSNAIIGHNYDIIKPPVTNKLNYGITLAVIIGKEGHNIDINEAHNHIFGYSVAQDITALDLIENCGYSCKNNNNNNSNNTINGQYLVGKTMDTFCPIGPSIVHKDAIKNPNNLSLCCRINGKIEQVSNTKDMIFNVNEIVSRVSKFFTLKPGDVILTGTPPMKEKKKSKQREFLKIGDVIESEISEIGRLVNNVVDENK